MPASSVLELHNQIGTLILISPELKLSNTLRFRSIMLGTIPRELRNEIFSYLMPTANSPLLFTWEPFAGRQLANALAPWYVCKGMQAELPSLEVLLKEGRVIPTITANLHPEGLSTQWCNILNKATDVPERYLQHASHLRITGPSGYEEAAASQRDPDDDCDAIKEAETRWTKWISQWTWSSWAAEVLEAFSKPDEESELNKPKTIQLCCRVNLDDAFLKSSLARLVSKLRGGGSRLGHAVVLPGNGNERIAVKRIWPSNLGGRRSPL